MTNKPDGKRWGWERWALIVVALLMLYPLSIGPAMWLADRLENHRLLIAYVPVVELSRMYRPFETVLLWYLGLFLQP